MDPQMQELFQLILENQTSLLRASRTIGQQLMVHFDDRQAFSSDLSQQIGYTESKIKELQSAPQGR